MTKSQLLSLIAASSLAAFAGACGSNDASEPSEAEPQATTGGEAEAACGGGACGAAAPADEATEE